MRVLSESGPAAAATPELHQPPGSAGPSRESGAPLVYFFGNGHADGTRAMQGVLGGKGANLAEMTNLGVPVPPGFTIACQAGVDFLANGAAPAGLRADVERSLARLEQTTDKRFGDPRDPLLVSVRSGAPVSMPGMMETILNLGLNDTTVVGLARASGTARFAYD
jgi:pyruvate,orthophosphate dikinase